MSKSCVTTFVHDNDGEVHTTVSTYGWDHDSVRDHRPRAVTTFRLGGVEVSVFTESIEVLHTIARAFEDTAAKLAASTPSSTGCVTRSHPRRTASRSTPIRSPTRRDTPTPESDVREERPGFGQHDPVSCSGGRSFLQSGRDREEQIMKVRIQAHDENNVVLAERVADLRIPGDGVFNVPVSVLRKQTIVLRAVVLPESEGITLPDDMPVEESDGYVAEQLSKRAQPREVRSYATQKQALTRAINRQVPSARYEAVLAECERVIAEWASDTWRQVHRTNSWPDDWHRWNIALSDAWTAARYAGAFVVTQPMQMDDIRL
jgi:hypothetical protein